MKLKSWHLALLGFVSFCIYLILETFANNARCNGNYEFGASDCHNEFSALGMIFALAYLLILAFPVVLLGVKKEAKKSVVDKWWVVTVFCLSLWFGIFLMSNRIKRLHPDGIADFLSDGIAWFFLEILYVSPLILAGWLVIYLLNRWRQALGAFLSILIGAMRLKFDIETDGAWSDTPWADIILLFFLSSAFFYLFAGFLFFLTENKNAENDATLK